VDRHRLNEHLMITYSDEKQNLNLDLNSPIAMSSILDLA